jgi:hypothetical protein
MRENRTSGSEGGDAGIQTGVSYPYRLFELFRDARGIMKLNETTPFGANA